MTGGALRERLRAETSAAHGRLHKHPGLLAAATGRIDLDSYRALLMRLYGFHRAFEACVDVGSLTRRGTSAARSELLASDLAALGVTPERRAALPLCATLTPIICPAAALGALYVVEGSALGGVGIARALRPVLLSVDGAACRFFSNDDAPRHVWKDLLARLDALCDPQDERAAIVAALMTFRAFEDWMAGWASPEAG